MPANLTPKYYSAEEKYKKAQDDREKMKALKEMLAYIPKHKGTDKLQGDIKRKISRLKEEVEIKKSKGGHKFSYSVEKEGAAQVVVVGPPNTGKSHLIASLSNINLEIANYPFTTRIFHPAMMPYEDFKVQLIDLPPVSEEYLENWVPSMIRVADMMLIVLDISRDDIFDQLEMITAELGKHKILMRGFENVEPEDNIYWRVLKTLVIANKFDLSSAQDNFEILKEFYSDKFELIYASAKELMNLSEIKHAIIRTMKIIRVYSKRPGKTAEMEKPFTFQSGSTLMDFAKAVHKDFSNNLKFARIWGEDVFDGQRVNKNYTLQDKDIIELHI